MGFNSRLRTQPVSTFPVSLFFGAKITSFGNTILHVHTDIFINPGAENSSAAMRSKLAAVYFSKKV
jgi:hypothetical protein